MAAKKHFLQDRTALLLVSGLSFLALASVVITLLQMGANHSSGNFITQCRNCSDVSDINRFTNGTRVQILAFVVFTILAYGVGVVLGYRMHLVNRRLAYVALALSAVLLVFGAVVANALLTS